MTPEQLEQQTREAFSRARMSIEAQIQESADGGKTWKDRYDGCWFPGCYYRIKPTPTKRRVPLTRDDWKGVWFLKLDLHGNGFSMVVSIGKTGNVTIVEDGEPCECDPQKLADAGIKRSRDCESWEPCYREEEVAQ